MSKDKKNSANSVWMVPYCLETGRFLIARRTGDQAGMWNLFGGKVDKGESAEKAVSREFKEEAGVLVKPKFLTPLGKKKIVRRNGTPGSMYYFMFRAAHEFMPKLNSENDKYLWVGNIPKERHKSLSTFLLGPHATMLEKLDDSKKIFRGGNISDREPEGRFETYTNTGSVRLSYIVDGETAACVDFITASRKLVNFYVSPRHRKLGCDAMLLSEACQHFDVKELVIPAVSNGHLSFFKDIGFALSRHTDQGSILEYAK